MPESIEGFKNWQFTSGCTTGEDFKRFARLFKNWLKKQLQGKGLQIVNYSAGHYNLFGFVTNGQQYVYFSVGDVRYGVRGTWHESILIRTAQHEKDYTGGSNNFTDLQNLAKNILNLL